MKRYAKLIGLLLVAAMLGGLLAACAPAPVAARYVVCPISLKALKPGEARECVTWNGTDLTPDLATRYQKSEAMNLGPRQVGIYSPYDGEAADLKIYRQLGYQDAPAPTAASDSPSLIISEVMVDIYTSSSCPADKAAANECVGPLDGITMAESVTAVTNYSFAAQLVVTNENARTWLKLGGYAGFKNAFWAETRRYKNIFTTLKPNFNDQGKTIAQMEDAIKAEFAKWKYIDLVVDPVFTLKGTVIGDDNLRGVISRGIAARQEQLSQADVLKLISENQQAQHELDMLRQGYQATLDAARAASFRSQVDKICAGIEDTRLCADLILIYATSPTVPPAIDANGNLTQQTGGMPAAVGTKAP